MDVTFVTSLPLAVVLKQVLLLKFWAADLTSKKAMEDLPFQGVRRFNGTLDEIINYLLFSHRPRRARNCIVGLVLPSQEAF